MAVDYEDSMVQRGKLDKAKLVKKVSREKFDIPPGKTFVTKNRKKLKHRNKEMQKWLENEDY